MLVHLIRDVGGDDVFQDCTTLDELYDFLQANQQESSPGGAWLYDVIPDTDEEGGRVLRIQEEYYGNEE